MKLLVHEQGRLVGALESTPDRGVIFRYDPEYLRERNARPLSLSLPLREAPYSQASAMPFFAGLLPDGDLKRKIADCLHISENSTLRLLDALGGECAGTVSILKEEDSAGDAALSSLSAGNYEYRELPQDELEALVRESERCPLLLPRDGARLSLAGAQDKIPLLFHDRRWFLPLGNAPSSHILKPSSGAYGDLVANEFFCMRLAKELGLPVAQVEMVDVGRPALLVRRYDRLAADDGRIQRVHQEDFCQALGIMPDCKYEADGGPGFAAIAGLIRRSCIVPLRDIEALVKVAAFNLLVGNCDAHGKNFSLIHGDDGIVLAPLYDLVSTVVYTELSTKLSMRMGGEYHIDRIKAKELEGFALDIGVRPRLVMDTLGGLVEAFPSAAATVRKLPELENAGPLIDRIGDGWTSRAYLFRR